MGEREFLTDILHATRVEGVRWIVPPKKLQLYLHTARYGNEPVVHDHYATAAFLVTV